MFACQFGYVTASDCRAFCGHAALKECGNIECNVSHTCVELLTSAAVFDPLYGDRLANHLPMALIALDRMGASSATMHAFFDHYARRLVRRQTTLGAGRSGTNTLSLNAFETWLAAVEAEIAADGVQQVMRSWLPRLMPELGASAFHCLIRLAYAVDAGSEVELKFALAFWASEDESLGSPGRQGKLSLAKIARNARQLLPPTTLGPGIISDRMKQVAATLNTCDLITQPSHIDLEEIAQFALAAYCEREDFTLLHVVTASHAMSVVAPFVQDQEMALRCFWHAVLIAYLSTGLDLQFGVADQFCGNQNSLWQQCVEKARQSLDDHTVKLTYTAWRQATRMRTPDPRYLQIALRKCADPNPH